MPLLKASFAPPPVTGLPTAISAQSAATWGLACTRAELSAYSGGGIKVAVLDTGFDLTHPDFSGRTIVQQSFVPDDMSVQDAQGHGTHCIGTACGPRAPAGQIRYGVAHGADIYVGKVLNNAGSGQEGWVPASNGRSTAAAKSFRCRSAGRSCPTSHRPRSTKTPANTRWKRAR